MTGSVRTQDGAPKRSFRLSAFLPFRVVALGQAMGQGLAKQYADEFGLSIPEWRTLALIGQHDGITAARVVAETPMDKATVSRAASGLTERHLVERVPHEEDRRATVLRLSPEGRTIFDQVAARALSYEDKVLASLNDEEREQLDALLTKLGDVTG